MPRDLLVSAPLNTVGQWVRVEPPFKVIPYRVSVSGNFVGDSVFLEELLGGLPTSPGPLPGNPGSLTANSQTGTVAQLVAISGPGDTIIDAPVEFIRARTGAFTGGTLASVRLLEAQ
jgi:hypothetical protein